MQLQLAKFMYSKSHILLLKYFVLKSVNDSKDKTMTCR